MRNGLEAALDDCLACLKSGQDLETCLQHYSEFRDELEPLLRLAVAMRTAYQRPSPSPEALARMRARFLNEAEKRRVAQATPWSWLTGWLTPSFSRGLATIAVALVLFFSLLGGSAIVSANSLPGEPLYPVKRASENVRLFLTIDEVKRTDLQREYEARRVTEVKEVIAQGREAQVSFGGVVDRVEGDTVIINGIAVQLPPEASSAERPNVGAKVQITAQVKGDGTVAAQALAVPTPAEAVSAATPAPVETATISPDQRPSPTATLLPKPTTDEPTATSEPTRTPVASPTLLVTETLTATEAAETVEPTETPTRLLTQTVTRTPTVFVPTSTPVPPPRDVRVRIEGRIDEISGDYWTVNGRRILTLSSTRVNQNRAKAQVGGWATVEAIKKPDGALIADEIVVIRGPEQPPQLREFSGTIDSLSGDRWVVSGNTVLITGSTAIEGTPEVGAIAHVKADQYADGRLIARQITVEQRPEQVVEFEGPIQSIGSDRWVVAGQQILIGPSTEINGTPRLGAIAEVEAVVRADGSKLARRIRVMQVIIRPTKAATSTSAPTRLPVTPEPTTTTAPASTPIAPTPRP